MPGALGLMDRLGGFVYPREPTGSPYVDNAPLGAMDPHERIDRLDREGIERCILYPTLGVLWVAECEDEELKHKVTLCLRGADARYSGMRPPDNHRWRLSHGHHIVWHRLGVSSPSSERLPLSLHSVSNLLIQFLAAE
jgi:hypothetical protein